MVACLIWAKGKLNETEAFEGSNQREDRLTKAQWERMCLLSDRYRTCSDEDCKYDNLYFAHQRHRRTLC
ncbi:unnamed protein product [Didymodactylos carnosus]|uniref:Uncharacterized protein n=1 Tax=Didymodactylos carnosus TaxID=1234261 RepID=A0A814KI40_9BILA|nr:unnamed protein product [Didymodactylos carnosus]CAF1052766.1 unnamed protein product [Didymodactylos carnosus]CAF3780500.1 unnamed protein product [Didymodactylos carnosus]CAF3822170.1 unnamed protein product [Didymodactylos carnosus]